MSELSRGLGRAANFDDFPSNRLDRLAELGFEWIWLMGVWQTGEAGRRVSQSLGLLRASYAEALPDFTEDDICGSPYAVASYTVSADYGGNEGLARLRQRLRERGVRIMLDFVPNHTAIDHPWVQEHSEFYVRGSQQDLEREPSNYISLPDGVFAHGRDPYFPGWPDTLQLNYGNPSLEEAMQRELIKIASQCDGVRCDMAMLITPEVFQTTWGIEIRPFWPETIRMVRATQRGFTFMAEVYWDLEWNLQQQGFNYTYDKRLYDRLCSRDARGVRDHLTAGLDFQDRLVRSLENHDEPRAAATFAAEVYRAAAVITYFTPGMRFFHDGQLEGRRIRANVHLCRRANEPVDLALEDFYLRLLSDLRSDLFRNGDWRLIETESPLLAFSWETERDRKLVVVNFGPARAHFSAPDLAEQMELPGWRYQMFDITAA